MKLVMTLLVRNEADIVAANIEYHLAQGVDFVIVTDHGSEDGTSEILREYERVGVAKVIRDDEEGHHQSNRVTHMVEVARLTHGADWVINNDADEFWWPLVGNLRDVFASIPPRFGQIQVQRRNFRPCAEDDGHGPFYSRLIYREASSSNLAGHTLEPKVAHRPSPGVVVAPGNHSLHGTELSALPAGEVLEVFHFPMRSYEQFERKVIQIGQGYEQVPDRSPRVGCDQLALLELQREGKLGEYYDGLVVDGDALERGLRLGTLVVDRRLDDFMRSLRPGEGPPARPDAPFARILLGRTMDALSEVEQNQEELAALHSENELASTHIEQLQKQISELSRRQDEALRELQDSADELQSTSQALHLLRTSRLLRYTAWARRLYYRVREIRRYHV
jgi:hypothetical protein